LPAPPVTTIALTPGQSSWRYDFRHRGISRGAAMPDATSDQRQSFGLAAMVLGLSVLFLIVLDSEHSLPWDLPRTWYLHRTLWGALGLALCAIGWKLQRRTGVDQRNWKPVLPGRRFRKLVVYTRVDCHLCDDAKAVLAGYLDYLPELQAVDIDSDPELQRRFGETIPVVELDGEIRFRGGVDEILLRRLIEATPAV
jgi:glutaredoxin